MLRALVWGNLFSRHRSWFHFYYVHTIISLFGLFCLSVYNCIGLFHCLKKPAGEKKRRIVWSACVIADRINQFNGNTYGQFCRLGVYEVVMLITGVS